MNQSSAPLQNGINQSPDSSVRNTSIPATYISQSQTQNSSVPTQFRDQTQAQTVTYYKVPGQPVNLPPPQYIRPPQQQGYIQTIDQPAQNVILQTQNPNLAGQQVPVQGSQLQPLISSQQPIQSIQVIPSSQNVPQNNQFN